MPGVYSSIKDQLSICKNMIQRLNEVSPNKAVLIGYASYMLIGWALLCLPFSQSAVDGAVSKASAMDHLFTATSAVSTTGLATVTVPETYSFVGQLIILSLIQFGGIGYMTLGSFVLLARRNDLTDRRKEITRATFTLPDGYSVAGIVRSVIVFTLVIETLGTGLLWIAFRQCQVPDALWQAIFHSISAFCTAGFSLFGNGLEGFAGDFWVNAIIAGLSLSGAIGFLAMSDIYLTFVGKRASKTLTTRIILHATFWSLIAGWLLIFLIEPAYRELPLEQRILSSGFQTMTALTTVGFNTEPIGQMAMPTTFVMLLLMILGASPSGTGGGLKSTSVSAAFATVWSTLHGRDQVTFWGCQVPPHRLTLAFASVVFYIAIFFVGGLCLLLVQEGPLADVLFETASALGTVGLSRGLTGELTPIGKLVIIALMFIGRIGPITFGLAIFNRTETGPTKDDLAV